jgi:hypothetical protein
MRIASKLKYIAAALTLAASFPASAAIVNFDDTAASGLYKDATTLTDHYAPLGLLFSGATAIGGSILNQSAELGFPALSGTDFLAFNKDGGTGVDERISFANGQTTVAVHVATYEEGFFSMTAYDVAGNVLAFVSQETSRDWRALTLTHAGIRSVVISASSKMNTWGLDDLSFDAPLAAVPEPGALMLIGAGLLGLMGARRRKSRAV